MRRQGEQVEGRHRHKQTGTSRGSEFCGCRLEQRKGRRAPTLKCGSQIRDEKILFASRWLQEAQQEKENDISSKHFKPKHGWGSSGGGVHSHQISIHGAVSELYEEYIVCHTMHRKTCNGRGFRPTFASARLIDNDTNILDWAWLHVKIGLLQKIPSTSRKVLSTRWIEQNLNGCRFPDYCWSRTVLHDKSPVNNSHNVTDSVAMSRVHFAKRGRLISEPKGTRYRVLNISKLGPCWKSQPVTLQGEDGVEIRIESVNKDNNSHSWVRISHGLNRLVTDLIDKMKYDDNEQETSETKTETIAFKNGCICFCKPIQGESKTKNTYLCLLIYKNCTCLVKDLGLILSQKLFRLSLIQCQNDWVLFFVMVIYLEKKMQRLNSGDQKMVFGTNLSTLNIGLTKM